MEATETLHPYLQEKQNLMRAESLSTLAHLGIQTREQDVSKLSVMVSVAEQTRIYIYVT